MATQVRSVKPRVFISSSHYDLRDLRSSLAEFLDSYGLEPLASTEDGFPNDQRLSPYASCLKVIEECQLVLVIIDHRYGKPFPAGWGMYSQYTKCTPTKAEYRHSLRLNKRLIIFVQQQVWDDYLKWGRGELTKSKDYQNFRGTMRFVDEVNKDKAYIKQFVDVRHLVRQLRGQIAFDLNTTWKAYAEAVVEKAGFMAEQVFSLSSAADKIRAANYTMASERKRKEKIDRWEAQAARIMAQLKVVRNDNTSGKLRRKLDGIEDMIKEEKIYLLLDVFAYVYQFDRLRT